MRSYEVIRQAVAEPGVKQVASALRVSNALVYKWCEPPRNDDDPDQSGARNPLDRVRELYMQTRDIRLVRWLCNEAGGFFVANPLPDPSRTVDEHIYDETRRIFREFSELLDAVTTSVQDDPYVDEAEAALIRDKWEDLKGCLEQFVVACEQGHYHLKDDVKAAAKSTRR
ncbi:MAG: hypothetical protein ACFCVE_03845 [Phycisphaerae bacterium]